MASFHETAVIRKESGVLLDRKIQRLCLSVFSAVQCPSFSLYPHHHKFYKAFVFMQKGLTSKVGCRSTSAAGRCRKFGEGR